MANTPTPNHHAIAVTLLNREYGRSGHPADPGRNFTVCFRTTSHAHQERELAQAICDAEQRGFERGREAEKAEVVKYLDASNVVGASYLAAHIKAGKHLAKGK